MQIKISSRVISDITGISHAKIIGYIYDIIFEQGGSNGLFNNSVYIKNNGDFNLNSTMLNALLKNLNHKDEYTLVKYLISSGQEELLDYSYIH